MQVETKINIKKYEEKYQSTKAETDLINLVFTLQDSTSSKDFEKKIKYTYALIDVITFEGIKNSIMYDYYIDHFNDVPPRDLIIFFYILDLLEAKELDLFISEFVRFYPQVAYITQETMIFSIKQYYILSQDNSVIDAGIKALEELSKNADDEMLKKECLVYIDSFNEFKKKMDRW